MKSYITSCCDCFWCWRVEWRYPFVFFFLKKKASFSHLMKFNFCSTFPLTAFLVLDSQSLETNADREVNSFRDTCLYPEISGLLAGRRETGGSYWGKHVYSIKNFLLPTKKKNWIISSYLFSNGFAICKRGG